MPTKYKYSVPDPGQLPRTGETVRYKSGLLEEDQDPVLYPETGHDTIKKILMHAYREYADEPYLGSREKSFNDKGEVEYGKYKWETYEECINKAIWLARSIYDKELFNTASEEGRKYNLIGIYSKNNEGWAITDLACCLSNMATVTLYDTLGADSSEYIIQQTELKSVVCTADHVDALIKIKTVKGVDHLQNIVIIGEIEHDDVATIERAGMNYYSIDALIEEGKHSKTELDDPHNQDLFTICYTSGTTGNPKGVKLHHGCITSLVGAIDLSPIKISSNDSHLSYLPLAHIFERAIFFGLSTVGARIGFYQGDVLKIVEDLGALRPTVFISVPRLYTKLYDRIQGVIKEAKGCKAKLLKWGIDKKLANYRRNGAVTHCMYDALIFKKMKARLGGRVRVCVTGSAPISKEILEFLKICFCCDILEGYGQTELTAANCITQPGDEKSGHVGGVFPSFWMKLVDVPEMDYLSTDMRNGENYPRGEICFKGGGAFQGYFKEPAKTEETIDKDGWVHTGDIGEIQPDGALRIIDRKKNIFKLSQGEYIAAEKLELIFVKTPLIAQIFVYGDSLQSFLVAIVVPDNEYVDKNYSPGYSSSSEYLQEVNDWFKECREEHKLNGLEIPKKLHVTNEEFNIDDGTLTPTFKLVRGVAKKKFLSQIKEMYGGAKLQGE